MRRKQQPTASGSCSVKQKKPHAKMSQQQQRTSTAGQRQHQKNRSSEVARSFSEPLKEEEDDSHFRPSDINRSFSTPADPPVDSDESSYYDLRYGGGSASDTEEPYGYYRPEAEPPKKVNASILPGSGGLQRASIKPPNKMHASNSRHLTSMQNQPKQYHDRGTTRNYKGPQSHIGRKTPSSLQPLRLPLSDGMLRRRRSRSPKSPERCQDIAHPTSPELEFMDDLEMECELQSTENLLGISRESSAMMAIQESDAEEVPELTADGRPAAGSVGAHNGADMAALIENLKKNSLVSRQNQLNQTQVTNSSTQQVMSSSTTTSSSSSSSSQRMQSSSSSQRLHHLTSEMKASSMKSDLTELKSSISEMKNLSSSSALNFQRLRSSMENLVDESVGDISDHGDIAEPLVTFPEGDTPPPCIGTLSPLAELRVQAQPPIGNINSTSSTESKLKFEQAASASASRMTSQHAEVALEVDGGHVRRVRTAADRAAASHATATHATWREACRTEHAATATAASNFIQEQHSLKAGEVSQQEANATSMKIQTDSFSHEKTAHAMAQQQARQTVTSSGMFSRSQEKKHMAQSNMTITSKGMCSKSSITTAQTSQLMNGITIKPGDEDLSNVTFEDLDRLSGSSTPKDIEQAISKYSLKMEAFIKSIKQAGDAQMTKAPADLNKLNEIMRRAWAVPTFGHELGYSLCNTLRNSGGLDLLMKNCVDVNEELKFSSAQLLEQCLTTENRAYVVEHGLERVVNVACGFTKRNSNSVDHSRVSTGILEHLFKHSEGTCSDVVKLGGLDAVLFECRKNDIDTLRNCAGALANLSLYGGADNQEAMIKRKVPMWLFPLAFHTDDNIKYYACLAIAVLVANKEIEAAVLKSGTLDLVEPFVTTHNPSEFAKSNLAHAHGQSKHWLERLVPVLSSKREEARNLAAFHFCMEAGIKKQQGNTEIFREIKAIDPLKVVASCPNAVASKYAAQALRLIGEEVPHKLSQQVPLWSTEDVREWVKQIGFTEYANNFVDSRVDGDLLLQLTEENLIEDIGLTNGIRRRRFTRELQNLKKMADYTSRDTGNLNTFLQMIGAEYCIYTYSMLNAGVDKDTIKGLREEQLEQECGIRNSIHRLRIWNSIRANESSLCSQSEENHDKTLDVFVSYRRSNGSQLASLLKVHLQLRGFTVFIDVERLEAGKFDNNLLQSIKQAKYFLLVLTPGALDRCIGDDDCKDWVHREIVAALKSDCNIIPIIDNYLWPEPEKLPEDMRQVCHFNGVRWIHDYQDACVDKLERFMRGELNVRIDGSLARIPGVLSKGDNTPSTPSTATIRGPPSYQRMHSSDSAKGSDKDNSSSSRD